MVNLYLDQVDFKYNGQTALSEITLELESNEMLGVIGPNGSGKSTLLKCVNHILTPKKGEILLNGNSLTEMNRKEIARSMAYVPQSENQNFPATVFDTVLMGRRPHMEWKPNHHDLNTCSKIITSLGMEEFALKDMSKLSGGERQKVLIARALAQEPEVLLLDEPTNNLDLKHQIEVMDMVKNEVSSKHITCLIAIHDLNLATRYCDRVALLDGGQLISVGEIDILTPEVLESVYGVKVTRKEDMGWTLFIPEAVDNAS